MASTPMMLPMTMPAMALLAWAPRAAAQPSCGSWILRGEVAPPPINTHTGARARC
jgi:hypothetical protein